MSTPPKSKRQKTGEGVVSSWPRFSERLDETETKDFFKDKGYIRADCFISEDELKAIKNELKRYENDVVPDLPPKMAFYESKGEKDSIIRLERMLDHDEFFKDLGESPAFNGLADLLLNEECIPNNVQYFSKPPGAKCTPAHQDGKYFMHDRGITFWLALDDADAENGCLYYVPQSDRKGELEHRKTDALGFSQALVNYKDWMEETEDEMAVKKGSLLGHHPYMVHRAGENKSKERWRPALGLTYWAKSAVNDKELQAKHAAYNAKLMNELSDKGRI
ncbi:phytanoyl-CoA dioxygenase-like [Asterias rubens]|uniref:phytanoyl-CoA dioxygenase-like n=1 Tax=Asterias rubens TaxID=7604 RepID=UPI0014556005|nr:phytanoyl-CoA dioxygenase-like [Asterias rubens]